MLNDCNVWLVVLRIYVNLEIFHPYRDLEAGDNQSEIVAARPGIEPRTSCSASQELNHCIIAAPNVLSVILNASERSAGGLKFDHKRS